MDAGRGRAIKEFVTHGLAYGGNEGGDKRMVTPYEKAKWYAEKLSHAVSSRWLITCNFRTGDAPRGWYALHLD